MKKITIAITGASGVIIAFELLRYLLQLNIHFAKNNSDASSIQSSNQSSAQLVTIHLVISKAGIITISEELGLSLSNNPNIIREKIIEYFALQNDIDFCANNFFVYQNNDWFTPIASGSNVDDAMVVCPCSMATLARIANGLGEDLIARACDVIIKERKNLILVPRETPFSAIHLENMLKLSKLGVAIVPPIPAFYNHPKSIADVINFIVARILDQLNIKNTISPRWET